MSSVPLRDGQRVGRFVLMHDVEGRRHALAAGSVAALCEVDDGSSLLMLPGGRLVNVPRPLELVLDWLDGRGPKLHSTTPAGEQDDSR